MLQPDYIHLRTHSEYSLIDSLNSIEDLINAAKMQRMPAIALTDNVNLFAAIKFYQAAIKAGIKPIIGADIWIENIKEIKKPFRLTLLCQNNTGYQNLIKLISKSYLEGQHCGRPLIQHQWIKDYHEGLIALSGGQIGDIGQALMAKQWDMAKQRLNDWKKIFPGRFYLELAKIDREDEQYYLPFAIELAKTSATPVVATNEVCFINEMDFEAHETRVCIHAGFTLNDTNRPKLYTARQYFRTQQEMQTLFADIPSALLNTVEIAKRCNLTLTLGRTCLPAFPVPPELSVEQYLAQKSQEGLDARLKQASVDFTSQAIYQDRLNTELAVINRTGFAGYFLIVADFINWAKTNHIFVGPGRGSGAGSLVAYALRISNLDPIPYDLLFERFLNAERISMPDFDIDFCMDNRDRVIEYVAKKYGRESVSQIITFGTMAAKAVVRDVGRVLGHPYGFVDKIAKLIPFEIGITLEKALGQEEQLRLLYQSDEDVKYLIDLAKKLEGLARNAGKHAGGVVIAPSPLTDFSPLYCEANDENIVTQFDKDDIEKAGLIKFDFLGLRTLTIIDWTLRMVNEKRARQNEAAINIEMIPLDDKATFASLCAGSTMAVFQLESRGITDLAKRLQPSCLEDIISLVALYRPGPLQSGMVDDFFDRKQGRAPVTYPHPLLEPILKPTYGVILYQEQVMKIAQTLANYTLGEADVLRSAMGKKKPEEMAKQRIKFIEGAQKNHVDKELANQIFLLMEKFAGYGFNKSHSAAYALLTYQTAWLKTHYPAQFMAAVLSSDMDKTDKVVKFYRECKEMQLIVLPPDINQSDYSFTVNQQNEILYGLGAIKGVGFAAVENIIQCRQSRPYQDLFDFCSRVDLRKVNKRSIEALIQSGSMDSPGSNREILLASLEKAMAYAEQVTQKNTSGLLDLFSLVSNPVNLWANAEPWTLTERMLREKQYLGLYFSGHPLDAYQNELSQLGVTPIANLKLEPDQAVLIAAQISHIRFMQSKRGNSLAFLTIEDNSGHMDVAVFAEVLEECRAWLAKDQLVIIEGVIGADKVTGFRINCRRLLTIEKMREQTAKYLLLRLGNSTKPDQIDLLKQVLTEGLEGNCAVWLEYQLTTTIAKIPLGPKWRVVPTDKLLDKLKKLLDDSSVSLKYSNFVES